MHLSLSISRNRNHYMTPLTKNLLCHIRLVHTALGLRLFSSTNLRSHCFSHFFNPNGLFGVYNWELKKIPVIHCTIMHCSLATALLPALHIFANLSIYQITSICCSFILAIRAVLLNNRLLFVLTSVWNWCCTWWMRVATTLIGWSLTSVSCPTTANHKPPVSIGTSILT